MSINSPVMRYHGAKFRLAEWVMSFFPEHSCYVEPFGGAAGVLMQKPRSYAEVYNDLDSEIVNVFEVIRDKELSKKLAALCVNTPFSREEFLKSYEPTNDKVEQARRTLFRAEAGFGSGGSSGHNTGFRIDSKREYSLASHIWSKYPERIAAFCERMQGVIIENKSAVEVIKNHDSSSTLHFVDPPYVLETRKMSRGNVYKYEMSNDDHLQLINELKACEGYVVLCGYTNELYEEELSSWQCFKKSARISSGRGTGVREECVWLNPRCSNQQLQPQLFDQAI